jgi:large subunit ribosomal protein L30
MPRTFIKSPTKGPKHTPKTMPMTNGKLRIKQVRSGIGKPQVQKDTLVALGLKHHQDEVVQQDSPSLRGQIKRVRHLLEVTQVTE